MPQIIAGNIDTKAGSAKFVDARGKSSTPRYAGFAAGATEANVLAVINAAGTLSNAAIVMQQYISKSEAAITASTAYDDAESSVKTGANFTFQNSVTLDIRSFRVPAPHISHIDLTGNFMKARADDADVDAFVAAILVALGGSWGYVNAPITTYASGGVTEVERPIVTEPV